jgi:Ca-activated chloride channel family protein
MPGLRFFTLLLALSLPLFHRAAAADAASDGPAIVVFDGSGSMWGNVGTEKLAKLDLVRQALRASLPSLSPRVRLGLMSFGQRRRADCSDVEVVAPPEAGPPERILSLADKLNPKGKGPLALALREAAKQIPADNGGSIIAIHDGIDNCGQDVCTAAADIAKSNPKARVYLISFGLEAPLVKSLACVGTATQGKTFDAQNSAQLQDALDKALTLANLERVDPQTGIAVPIPKAATPPAPVGEPGLRLTAALTEDGKPLAAALRWTVAKADAPEKILTSARTRELDVDLAPGSYIVEGKLGQVTIRKPFEVAANAPTVAKLSLDAGVLNIKAPATRDGATPSKPLITVSSKSAEGDNKIRPLWVGQDSATQLVLPAGAYIIRVEEGLASHSTDLTITAGSGADFSPVLSAGRLELSAVTAANGETLTDVTYTIEEDDPESPAGRREVARSADPSATFTLPAGTYYVSARSGAAEAHDRIALGSGDTIKHSAKLNLVTVAINVSQAIAADTSAASQAVAAPVVIRVLSEDGKAREFARTHGTAGTFKLPPARYRVEAEIIGVNVRSLGVIDLTTGRGGNVQLKLDQGEVSVAAASPQTGRSWRIEDGEGRTVMHSGRSGSQTFRLAPGRYVLLSSVAERESEQPFELKTGERLQLTAGQP